MDLMPTTLEKPMKREGKNKIKKEMKNKRKEKKTYMDSPGLVQ